MVGGVDQAAWLAWAATVGGAGAPAALDDGRAHASSPSLPDVGRLQWLRFHDAALEEEFVRRFDSRQVCGWGCDRGGVRRAGRTRCMID